MVTYDKEEFQFTKAQLSRFYYGAYDFESMSVPNVYQYVKFANKIIREEQSSLNKTGR